jgi:hypothetical protein
VQEEAVLCCLLSTAICFLLLSLSPTNSSDYVFAALFLTCTSAVLKMRWFIGTAFLAVPMLVAAFTNLRFRLPEEVSAAAACQAAGLGDAAVSVCAALPPATANLGFAELVTAGPLPLEALVHILVAWAVGGLMAYVSGEDSRRCRQGRVDGIGGIIWAGPGLLLSGCSRMVRS